MKSPPAVADDYDDIFGPPRTYPTGYCPPKNRPSMISAKYRQKEERRKVLKISLNKLKKIEDPESSLCRSVLINNTMRRLQKEARDEKTQKQQVNYPREEVKSDKFEESQEFVVENDFDAKLAEEIVNAKEMLSELVGEIGGSKSEESPGRFSRKRSFDESEEDVQDVLKQFYMPPTPRMLTCIDEEDETGSDAKRAKIDEVKRDLSELCDKNSGFSVNSFINNNAPSESRLRYTSQSETDSNAFSCGHASMFSELQNNVYHNLIASLET